MLMLTLFGLFNYKIFEQAPFSGVLFKKRF